MLFKHMDSKHSDQIPSPDMFAQLTKEEQEAVLALKAVKDYKKGTLLLKEGDIVRHSYFVMSGCVRQYQIIDGTERTSNFYTAQESIWLSGIPEQEIKSSFYLETLEDSRMSIVSLEQEQDMFRRFPRFQEMCRIASEQELRKVHESFARFMSSSPEQRYLNIMEERPDLLDRVPQYHLASYLGITAESLSRIRKRLANKHKT